MSWPRIEDSYTRVVQALRLLLNAHSRRDHDRAQSLLGKLGDPEAARVLPVVLRDAVLLAAEASSTSTDDVLDRLLVHNIEQAEGLEHDS
jgi:hypothetical protein